MTTIEREVFIQAAPETVTAVSENPSRLPEWFTSAQKVDVVGNWPNVGSVVHLDMQAPGMTFKLTFTSLEHIAQKKLVIKIAGLTNGSNTWQYKAVDGGTAVSYTLIYTLSDSAKGQEMSQLISKRANEISIEQSLNKLKALIEG